MSLEAMSWVLNDAPGLPSHAFAVLVGLANHADADGRGAYLGQGRLGHYARKTDRQVRRDLQDLEGLGLIRRGNQRLVAHLPADKRPVVWDLAMERRMPDWHFEKGDPEGVGVAPENAERPDTGVRPDVDDRAPTTGPPYPAGHERPDVDVPPDTGGRTSMAQRPDVDVLQTVLEPEATTTTSSSAADAADGQPPKRPAKPDPLLGFDAFWSVYPKKVGKDAAQRAYAKAVKGGADPAAIVEGAQLYAMDCRTVDDPHWIKHPQGWLNDGRWADEPLQARAPRVITGPSEAAAAMPRPVAEVLAEQASYGNEPDDEWPPRDPDDDPFAEPPY